MENKTNIAIIGDAGCGKTAFIHVAKKCPPSTRYFKTIGHEAHPFGTYNGKFVTLWEFGHHSDMSLLRNMDGIIYITTKDTDFTSDKPYTIVMNKKRKAQFDTESILRDLINKL